MSREHEHVERSPSPQVESDLAMAFAHLRLRVPEATTFLLAPPRSFAEVHTLARGFASLAAETGYRAALADLTGAVAQGEATGASGGLTHVHVNREDLWNPASLRRLFTIEGLLFAYGGGLLDNAGTLVAASVVDGVVIVARRGKTSRTDLEAARLEIERAGGRLLGSLLTH